MCVFVLVCDSLCMCACVSRWYEINKSEYFPITISAEYTELDAISGFSEIVPDTVIFDDFER